MIETNELQRRLLAWFEKHRRPLPWRSTYEPYDVWIAEMMMQQTQMSRGVQFFLRWKTIFPDIRSVAEADEQTLLAAWEGLGYYRRVRSLQAAARQILSRHGGVFPSKYEEILALPGIGTYTAGAIASTAFNLNVPSVDGNVARVLSRLYNIATPVNLEPAKSEIRRIATDLIPEGRARDFNQALMEMGALVCGRSPSCHECVLQELCLSYQMNIVDFRPVVPVRSVMLPVETVALVLRDSDKLLVRQRPADAGLWAGLWEFPCMAVPKRATVTSCLEEMLHEYGVGEDSEIRKLTTIRYSFTNHKASMISYFIENYTNFNDKPGCGWYSLSGIERLPMGAPQRKLADVVCKMVRENPC